MSWGRHASAFYAEWVLRYLHPGDAEWKQLWDHILLIDDEGLERYPQGRAILISRLSKQDKNRILNDVPKECAKPILQNFMHLEASSLPSVNSVGACSCPPHAGFEGSSS